MWEHVCPVHNTFFSKKVKNARYVFWLKIIQRFTVHILLILEHMLTLTFTTVIPTQIADMTTDIHNGGWIVVIAGWIDAILALKLSHPNLQPGTPT